MVDLNATKAAIRAGYSDKNAHVVANQIINKPLVAAAIAAAQVKVAEKTEITVEWVLDNLKNLAKKCLTDGDTYNPGAANKSLELIGRHLGMFTDKLVVKTSNRFDADAIIAAEAYLADRSTTETYISEHPTQLAS